MVYGFDGIMGFKVQKLSKIFRPLTCTITYAENGGLASNSHKLMVNLGLVHHVGNGFYGLLPLAHRSFEKLIKLVDYYMLDVGAQKMLLPTLTSKKLWETAGTFKRAGKELFILKDRLGKDFILSPTHEEAFTDLLSTVPLSYREFPLLLYQITSKFRDEGSPKHGLIRTKEFTMKDLYSFHTSVDSAKETYDMVIRTYENIFDLLGLEYHKVIAVTEPSRIYESHEFHYPCDAGDDKIWVCPSCNYSVNGEVVNKNICPRCTSTLSALTGLEVAHTFSFGHWYSNSLKSVYVNKDGKRDKLLMCSYGIGLSRLLAASLECLSTDLVLRWPLQLAPYTLCLIPPKNGSHEESVALQLMDDILKCIHDIGLPRNDLIIDDRTYMTIGKRMQDCNALGFPFVIVFGRETAKEIPQFEVHNLNKGEMTIATKDVLLEYLKDNIVPIRSF